MILQNNRRELQNWYDDMNMVAQKTLEERRTESLLTAVKNMHIRTKCTVRQK